jgi:hypothetical protein
MNTSLRTLFAVILGCLILSQVSSAKATDIYSRYSTILPVKDISKIVVSGNVQLILVQDGKEKVNVYAQDTESNATVQQDGNTLKISSFRKTPLSVVVFVNNLNELNASDKVSVKTIGKFNLVSLSVKLQGQATADISGRTVNLYTTVAERAGLKLCGATESHMVIMSTLGNLNLDQFAAIDTFVSTWDASKYVVR